MSNFSKWALFWTSRALAIYCIVSLSLFVFHKISDGHLGFCKTVLVLIPILVLIATLILAWRWQWIGAALCAATGLLHIAWILLMQSQIPGVARPIEILINDGPAFVIAGLLVLANWLKRVELRPSGVR